MVKSEFVLRNELLTVPESIAEPRLRAAGLAWLDMALELFSQEVLSGVSLSWRRPLDGSETLLVLVLDSSKNYQTKELMARPNAPPTVLRRRERFDEAVAKLMTRTSPEDLWAALANQSLAHIGAWDFTQAWSSKTSDTALRDLYPSFSDSREFLFYRLQALKTPSHPWL
ncbi:hypothetical protein [Burkholderia ubonensis]|uniref:hypothetical protein n=1 Tax=Burkholderia ubonensis TaxID=101571 RepID=UPI00075D781D|nr:hypothetical protein [Burkholderia ubonensis]